MTSSNKTMIFLASFPWHQISVFTQLTYGICHWYGCEICQFMLCEAQYISVTSEKKGFASIHSTGERRKGRKWGLKLSIGEPELFSVFLILLVAHTAHLLVRGIIKFKETGDIVFETALLTEYIFSSNPNRVGLSLNQLYKCHQCVLFLSTIFP